MRAVWGRAGFAVAPAILALLLVLVLPAAAGAQNPGPAYSDWNPDQIGYPSNALISPRATCDDGARGCIDRTLGEMYRRFNTVVPACDDNNVFSLTYLRVTEDIRNGIDEGYYTDERWLSHLDALFARPYFLAYDNYRAGRMDLVPPSWRIAFGASHDGTVKGIGNLLLSMNAHVNRDFPFVLYQAGLVDADGKTRKAEHDAGNARLRALYRPMITELSQRFDASIDDVDIPGIALDDDALFDVLVLWRETAWQNAERLAAAKTDAERRQVAASIEAYALTQAEQIYAGSAYLPIENTAERDARCAANGGQDLRYKRGSDVAHVASKGAVLLGRHQLAAPLRCPNGPGPCRGYVRAAGRGKWAEFNLGAGEKGTVPVRIGRRARNGRVQLAVRSLLGPGVDVMKRRAVHPHGLK